MKILKPVYSSEKNVYSSSVSDPPRFQLKKEDGAWNSDGKSPAEALESTQRAAVLSAVLAGTSGWFTKPLTEEWLSPRLHWTIEHPDISEDWEGVCTWKLQSLLIAKDSFTLVWGIESLQKAEPICIELGGEPEPEAVAATAPAAEAEPVDLNAVPAAEANIPALGIGPTRQVLEKQRVLKARARAARALFYAERLTQEYMNTYGGETDWEDEDDLDGGASPR